MAATVSGAIKAVVEAAGLGISVYRDAAPQGATLPYAIAHEGITGNYDRLAFGDVQESAQIDVWQERGLEDSGLALQVAVAILRGTYPKVGAGTVVDAAPSAPVRIPPAPDATLVRCSFDVTVTRRIS